MKKRPIYYDTETTGVRADKDRIIELAAYDPIEDRTFISFINPKIPIPKEATNIHHITDEMVFSAPLFDEVAQQFVAFCPPHAVLIAHNNDSFDKLFIEKEFERSSIPLPAWEYLDSLRWARKYRPDLPRHTLQHLREVYGITANNAHRALDDVLVLMQVFTKMIGDLPIETVLELLKEQKVLSRMPFGKHQGKPLEQVPKSYVEWLHDTGAFEKSQNKELKDSFEKLGLLSF